MYTRAFMASNAPASNGAQRAIALLIGLVVALLVACVFLWSRPTGPDLSDPSLREEAIQQMMSLGDGFYDNHPDPDVGKVMQPHLDGAEYFGGLTITTNAFGVREREWASPKQPGSTRVVLLGDSFVLGSGINVPERMGTHLERYLEERAQKPDADIEVLMIGMGSWNVRSECAFLRRQLGLLRPDLVIQLLVNNDLDDVTGVRGFGGFATATPQIPEHVTGIVQRRWPKQELSGKFVGWVSHGLDWESRSRYEQAVDDLRRLQAEVEHVGGEYQLMLAWGKVQQAAFEGIGQHWPGEKTLFMSPTFGTVQENRVAPNDGHWSGIGNEKVAKMLYAKIVERRLLPELDLPVWEEASTLARDFLERGRLEAREPKPLEEWLARSPISTELDLTAWTDARKAQVHGGIDLAGRVFPYASVILATGGSPRLTIEGRALPRPELRDLEVDVFCEDRFLGKLAPRDGEPFSAVFDVPPDLRERRFVSVRFQASDYVYRGRNLRECVSFLLTRIAFGP